MEEQHNPSAFTPPQMLQKIQESGVAKAKLRFLPLIVLSILAGMYIAFGGIFSTVVATGMLGASPYGLTKTLMGLVFSLGLILVVVGGAELFTGNMLMVIPLLARKISFPSLCRNWILVFIGNFVGSILIALLMVLAHAYEFSGGQYGMTMFTIANSKMHYSFLQAVSLGILCNTLVCLAVWLAFSARNTTDKIFAIIFPITAFIAAGFEHSVANMYLIPVALFTKTLNPAVAAASNLDFSQFTWNNFLVHNLLPVTIGNMIGGILLVGVAYFVIYHRHGSNGDSKQ